MTTIITKRAGSFSETEIDDEIVVMHLDSGDFFSLTDTAVEIWRLLDGTRSRDAIITDLSAAYDAPQAEIAADVDRFLARLREAGLVSEA